MHLLYYLCPKRGAGLYCLFLVPPTTFCSRKTIPVSFRHNPVGLFTGMILEKIQARGLKRMANAAPEDKKQLKKVLKRQKSFSCPYIGRPLWVACFPEILWIFSDNINRLFRAVPCPKAYHSPGYFLLYTAGSRLPH